MQGFYSKHLNRLLLALVLLVGVVSLVQAQDNVLVPGSTVTGTLDTQNRALVYTFSGTEGQAVSFVITGETGLQLGLLVTDSVGQTLLQFVDDQPSGPDTTDEITCLHLGFIMSRLCTARKRSDRRNIQLSDCHRRRCCSEVGATQVQ
jgi:hypothetical protein